MLKCAPDIRLPAMNLPVDWAPSVGALPEAVFDLYENSDTRDLYAASLVGKQFADTTPRSSLILDPKPVNAFSRLAHGVAGLFAKKENPWQREKDLPWKERIHFDERQLMPNARGKIIVFYPMLGNSLYYDIKVPTSFVIWLRALGHLGFDVELMTSEHEIKQHAAHSKAPTIVAFSAVSGRLRQTKEAYDLVKKNWPDTVTVMGGVNAVSAWAEYIDYVLLGEGDIFAPAIFKTILEGRRAEMAGVGVFRHIFGPDGKPFKIRVNAGENLFLNTGKGYRPGNELPVEEQYLADKARWNWLYPSEPFPLDLKKYALAIRPIPINEEEIDKLYLPDLYAPPHIEADQRVYSLYAQRGCYGSCHYCAIKNNFGGRRPSVNKVLQAIKTAISQGAESFVFGDDLFVQDINWLNRLFDEIERRKYYKKIHICCMTRIDNIPPAVIDRLRKLDFSVMFGLETLDPKRAEGMGKVPVGAGDRYVSKAKEVMLQVAAKEPRDFKYNVLFGLKGDSLQDFSNELVAQLEMVAEIWREHRVVPFLRFSVGEDAYNHSQDTIEASGFLDGQPRRFLTNYFYADGEADGYQLLNVNRISGSIAYFQHEAVGADHSFHGIFEPERFQMPPWMVDIRHDIMVSVDYHEDVLLSKWMTMENLDIIYHAMPNPANDFSIGDAYGYLITEEYKAAMGRAEELLKELRRSGAREFEYHQRYAKDSD